MMLARRLSMRAQWARSLLSTARLKRFPLPNGAGAAWWRGAQSSCAPPRLRLPGDFSAARLGQASGSFRVWEWCARVHGRSVLPAFVTGLPLLTAAEGAERCPVVPPPPNLWEGGLL